MCSNNELIAICELEGYEFSGQCELSSGANLVIASTVLWFVASLCNLMAIKTKNSHDETSLMNTMTEPLIQEGTDGTISDDKSDISTTGTTEAETESNESNDDANRSSSPKSKRVTYWSLLSKNSNFRWFLLSFAVTTWGEWLTYVASIATIEQIHTSNGSISRTSISILVILRLLPTSLFAPIGGTLADSYDRRKIMFILDGMGALVVWLYVLSYYLGSIAALYVATLLQMTVAALYRPSHTAIVPMLVPEEGSLEKAMILVSSVYLLMQAVGSSTGGILTGFVGIQYCFMIDSSSYLVSALFMWKISGEYNPVESNEAAVNEKSESSWFSLSNFTKMTKEGISYLASQSWGAFVLLKFFASLIYGAADVLNVSFSEQAENSSEMKNLDNNSKLGILFAIVGIGSILGPIIIEPCTHMEKIPSLERACLISFFLMALGYCGQWQFDQFISICIFALVRSAGANIVWVYSSLLLQKLSSASMLGRVFGIDNGLATLAESVSALFAGLLQDGAGLSAAQVSLIMSIVALATLVVWGIYFSKVSTTESSIPTERSVV
jgi:MFS family permease